ncbi:MAG: 4Fe-4S dicluster domain-containing protein [Actinomycetota bacterium]|nr:4Fe-4S dicluster domain-containing protein [Actinomycetota bacterium]
MLRFIKNFFITLGNLFRKPRTVVYPKEKIIIPDGSRGVVHLKLDPDSLDIICNGCGRCSKICPAGCIEINKRVEENSRIVLEEFIIDLNKCIFCGNCVDFCEIKAIEMSYRYQLADDRKKNLRLDKNELRKPSGVMRDFW